MRKYKVLVDKDIFCESIVNRYILIRLFQELVELINIDGERVFNKEQPSQDLEYWLNPRGVNPPEFFLIRRINNSLHR